MYVIVMSMDYATPDALGALLLTWINNNIQLKCEMKLLIHSQNSAVQLLKFGNGLVMSPVNLQGGWLLIHAGIKVNPFW